MGKTSPERSALYEQERQTNGGSEVEVSLGTQVKSFSLGVRSGRPTCGGWG